MDFQISIDDLLKADDPPVKVEIPVAKYENEKIYTIPDDVWTGRCRKCVHKNADENIPVPISAVHRQQYAEIIPCRIMAVSRPHDIPGECLSFAPRLDTYGICRTCVHTSHFHEGYCMKADHAPKRTVYMGKDYGQEYYRQSLSVCDDYDPDLNVKEGRY